MEGRGGGGVGETLVSRQCDNVTRSVGTLFVCGKDFKWGGFMRCAALQGGRVGLGL